VSGAFRFVSGSAPKGAYTIKTPAGTIGVRGTIIQFTIIGNVVTLSLIEGGTTFCITPSQCTDLNKPGTYVVVTGDQVSAQEVLNALGCGATACNDTSYKQGDQTTYIIYFSDDKVRPISFTPPVEEEHHHHHHHWWFFGWFHHHHHHHHHHHYPWWSFIWFHHHHHYWWSYHWFHHHHHHWWFYSWFHHHHHHHYRRHHHWHFAYYYNRFHHHHHHRHHHHRRDAR
jgi:son of sevenless-like protein